MESRLRLTGAWQMMDTLILAIAFLGFALLLIFLVTGKGMIQRTAKIKYALILSAVILAVAVIFGLMDPVYEVGQYITMPTQVIVQLVLFLLADLIIERFQRRALS